MNILFNLNIWIFLIATTYILCCFFLAIEGNNRKIGALKSLIFSFVLTPIFGYYIINKSQHISKELSKKYICKRCKHTFNDLSRYCPVCIRNGRYVKLSTFKKSKFKI